MRVEINCTKCQVSVLVLDVDPNDTDPTKPDAVDQIRKIKAAGWGLNKQGPVCTEH